MKILVTKELRQQVEVDIELPYYFKLDLLLDQSDKVIYGKVDATECFQITIDRALGSSNNVSSGLSNIRSVEIERTTGTPDRWGCYFEKDFESTKAEYLDARAAAQRFLDAS